MGLSVKHFLVGFFFSFCMPEVCASANKLFQKAKLANQSILIENNNKINPWLTLLYVADLYQHSPFKGQLQQYITLRDSPPPTLPSKSKDHSAVSKMVGPLNFIE